MARKGLLDNTLYGGDDLFGQTIGANTVGHTSLSTAGTTAHILQPDSEIAARHTAPQNDTTVQYIVWLEKFYAEGSTNADEVEFTKVKKITVDALTITLGDITLRRENGGKIQWAGAQAAGAMIPTVTEWENIFAAIPGGSECDQTLKTILGIELDRYCWARDAHNRYMMISVNKKRAVTMDDGNPQGSATLWIVDNRIAT